MPAPRIPFSLSDRRTLLPDFEGKRLLAHVVVNVESWSFDTPMPRKLLGSPHGHDRVPDVPNFGWVEYGMRCGLPRLFTALADRSIPASASLNASVIEDYPDAARGIKEAGWEVIGHGVTQRSLPDHESESDVIEQTMSLVENFFGYRPRGWLGPGLQESLESPDYLSAAGMDYICDWVVDDVPVWLHANPRPLVAVPYTLELNDSVLYAAQWNPSREFETRTIDTLACYAKETESGPRVLTLGLHPHLIGVPHRIGALERVLDLLAAHEQVAFVTGSQICDWFVGAQPC